MGGMTWDLRVLGDLAPSVINDSIQFVHDWDVRFIRKMMCFFNYKLDDFVTFRTFKRFSFSISFVHKIVSN